MKVKITKAKETYWYAKHIGEVFEVEENYDHFEHEAEYETINGIRELGGDPGFIGFSDCEVITEPTDSDNEAEIINEYMKEARKFYPRTMKNGKQTKI